MKNYYCILNEVNNMERTDLDQMAMQIKEKRKAYGYTQEEMAEQLNISYSFYTKIENGFQAPSLDTLIRIATTLQISLDKLIFGNSRKIQPFSPDVQELFQFISQYNRAELIHCRNLLNKLIGFLN